LGPEKSTKQRPKTRATKQKPKTRAIKQRPQQQRRKPDEKTQGKAGAVE